MKTRQLLLTPILLCLLETATLCQSTPPIAPALPAPTPRTTVDETFDLNISERQITRENFEASTSLRTDGKSHLDLQIGVGLAADRIDVLLRNVQGHVRFRGTLDRILQLLAGREPVSPVAPPK